MVARREVLVENELCDLGEQLRLGAERGVDSFGETTPTHLSQHAQLGVGVALPSWHAVGAWNFPEAIVLKSPKWVLRMNGFSPWTIRTKENSQAFLDLREVHKARCARLYPAEGQEEEQHETLPTDEIATQEVENADAKGPWCRVTFH